MSAIPKTPVDRPVDTLPRRRFKADVLAGLRQAPKTLPCKYFYDERGSRVFDQICDLDEYYLTRTELKILESHVQEMADCLGRHCLIIEFGAGSGIKTRLLLDNVKEPAGYIPIDISGEHLEHAAQTLRKRYPGLDVLPLAQDFTAPIVLPKTRQRVEKRVVYFPGSTISNFGPQDATALLRHMARLVGPGGGLLIGVDLKKAPALIEPAYNDAKGVTAAFNLNLLVRINRELGADFQLEGFRHQAVYNEDAGRIEMYLISRHDQIVHLDAAAIVFRKGEGICTEYSYKFGMDEFQDLASRAGFQLRRAWNDDRDFFSVQYLTLP
ncbi:MAG: L-histidine N(alpha)-methyltransferase [Gemmataceae bacterium]